METGIFWRKAGNDYKKWFVKDTTISGIMGAIGANLKDIYDDYSNKYKDVIIPMVIIRRFECINAFIGIILILLVLIITGGKKDELCL